MHAAIELAIAGCLILLPYAAGLSAPAVMVGIAAGGLLAGLAISGSASQGRGTIPLSAHAVYDWAIATGLVCAGIVLGFVSGPAALIIFFAAGAAELALSASTTYSRA